MALITTYTVPALQDLIQKSFIQSVYNSTPSDVKQLFIKVTTDWSTNLKRMQEVDRERFAEQKVEGAPSAQRGLGQGYYKDIYRKTISLTRKVSGEEYNALQDHQLATYAMNTAQDVTDKIDLDQRNFLGYGTQGTSYVDNGGFTIDTTTGDGQAIFSTAHTLKFNTATYSNIISGAPSLTNTAIETAEDFFSYNVLDNYGQRMSMSPNTIITSKKATMVNRIERLLGSQSPESLSGTAQSNAGVLNTYKDKYSRLVVEFDVDAFNVTNTALSYYWFLARVGGSAMDSLQWYYISWLSPMVATPEVWQDKWVMSWTARAAYGIGAVSSRGIVVSKATS
jgi:hypothetical protein